jgi:ParB family chromosome partitioning protein
MAAANTFRQMTNTGVIKRADSEKIELHNLHFEDGFNPPGRTDQQDEEDEQLFQHIMEKGLSQLPQLEVRPREPEGAYIVDGHRRVAAIRRAVTAGKDLADPKDGKLWIRVRQFEGNDVERVIRIITSNSNKKLPPVHIAFVYTQLIAFQWTPQMIADRFKVSRQSVDSYLTLGNANHDVQKLVGDGVVTKTAAVEAVREHADAAGPVLSAALKVKQESGKEKVKVGAADIKVKPAVSKRELLIAEVMRSAALNCYSPDDSAADWAEKIRAISAADIIMAGVK